MFVNRRWVTAPALQQALEAAYRPLLPPGRHPIVVLFVEVPPGAVDVNVHPSKAEVKLLWEADLAAAVGEAVKRGDRPEPAPPGRRAGFRAGGDAVPAADAQRGRGGRARRQPVGARRGDAVAAS